MIGSSAQLDEQYDPQSIERDVQAYWQAQGTFHVTEDASRDHYFCLSMFPYPSGRLHMGHVRNYTIGDVIARYQRMLGKNVLQPMGWDAFGLPAENAAIQNKVAPAQWTQSNIAYMRDQLRRLGFGYDWDRELATCKPDYYRWEQWLFTRLLEKGLVYKKTSPVNWCPNDQTVLANEQVVDGCCWRCDTPVERREIPQWFMKITAYADELLRDLDTLKGWPDQVLTMQRNWIGRSEGVELDFAVAEMPETLRVYTTRPDTLMGVTYLAVAAEHPLAMRAAARSEAVTAFIEDCRQTQTSEATLQTMEKRGVPLGIHAIHPISGQSIPVWVANFVLMSYGTGAVMSVPAHDQRDFEFARAFGLPIRQVIFPAHGESVDVSREAFTAKGVLQDSGQFSGLTSDQAFVAIAEHLEHSGQGQRRVNFRLRDWGISRQRYWGTPIPIINCVICGAVPVPAKDLPVVLPTDVAFDGVVSPVKRMPEFYQCNCPKCGGAAERETDTFDTFFESSWYYARFASYDCDTGMLDQRVKYWLPVDQYIGGIEHAILHLLYARFFHKLLRDEGLVAGNEPFTNLLTQGMVVAETYFRLDVRGKKVYFAPNEVDVERDSKGRVAGAKARADGLPVQVGGIEKMSKSKRNGVDPQDMIERFGADTVRMFMMFAAPPEQSLEWTDTGVEGASRFLRRFWRLVSDHVNAGLPTARIDLGMLTAGQREMRRQVHATIQKITDDMGRRFTFNTAIAATMELVNALYKFEDVTPTGRAVMQEAIESLVLLLAPIIPHVSHTLWSTLGHTEPVVDAAWPRVDARALVQDSIELAVQVNGKLRGTITVALDADRDLIERVALADANVMRHVAGKAVKKTIVVPNKLVNIVVAG